jgi:signal transduction histidine kinase
MLKLRILHKGLAFLIIPLLLQIVCIVILFRLIDKAQTLAKDEAITARKMEFITEMVAEFGTSLNLTGALKNQSTIDPDQYKAHMEGMLRTAKTIFEGSADTHLVDESRSLLEEEIKIMKLINSAGKPTSYMAQFQMLAQLKPLLPRTYQHCNELRTALQLQRKSLERVREQEALAAQEVRNLVLFGVFASIALTIALVSLFLQDITKRLNLLVDNARQIPTNNALTKSVPGSDELAYLDVVLHKAATDLLSAREHRTALMQMVAHDLRTPLMTAQLAIGALGKKSDSASEQEHSARCETAQGLLASVVSFVEDLLTVEKLEAGKLELNYEIVELQKLVDLSFSSVALLASEKRIWLQNHTQPILLGADRARLMQVLNNLLSNAIKHSPPDSAVTVSSEEKTDQAIISVVDAGQGISLSEQEKLFQKFYQSKDQSGTTGFGLGLAICKSIVEAHGGTIGVSTVPGSGSTFWLSLPLDTEEV